MQLDSVTTAMFEKNPNEDNILYAVRFVGNQLPIADIFQDIITEGKENSISAE